jgi:hypothetical protein
VARVVALGLGAGAPGEIHGDRDRDLARALEGEDQGQRRAVLERLGRPISMTWSPPGSSARAPPRGTSKPSADSFHAQDAVGLVLWWSMTWEAAGEAADSRRSAGPGLSMTRYAAPVAAAGIGRDRVGVADRGAIREGGRGGGGEEEGEAAHGGSPGQVAGGG